VKRLIGRKFTDAEVKKDLDLVPYKIIQHDNRRRLAGDRRRQEALAAGDLGKILMKMKRPPRTISGEPVTEAVITVPAYFNDSQRQATKDAGPHRGPGRSNASSTSRPPQRLPTASTRKAATARLPYTIWVVARSTCRSSKLPKSTGEKQFEVLATNGDTFLGGEDFDKRLIDFSRRRIQEGIRRRSEERFACIAAMKDGAERAKIELSSAHPDRGQPAATSRPTASGPKHMNIKLTRAKLESLVADLIKATIGPCALQSTTRV